MSEPVTWTFRPDWSNRVVERLEWVTEILGSTVGAEQAIAVRYAQRRSVEARFVAEGRERSFMALMIERLGSGTFRVPLWFHRALLVSPVAASATALPCDTVNREFRTGDFALLVGPDAFTCETVEITAVSGTELTLAAGVDADWPAGTVVHPLRTAWMEVSSRQNPTARVSEGNIRFEIDAGEDIDSGVETLPLYNGLPLLVQQPNWAESLGNGYAWLRDEHDSKTGLRIFADTAGRAFRTTRYGLLLHGREEQAGFRALLRRLRGRQGAVWMPAHTWDVELAAGAASGGTALEIGRIGLNEIGGYSPEIAHLLFADGTAVEWSALEAPADPANERLTMATPLPRDFAAGERGTFIQASRLDQDTITITHETDSDGAATVALSWTAIDDSRDGSADGDYPIPVTAMTAGSCGCEEGNLQLPLKMVATLPGPVPLTVFGDMGVFFSLPVVFVHDGVNIGRKIDAGFNKSVIVYSLNPDTLATVAFLSQEIDPTTYIGAQDFSFDVTIGLGSVTLDGRFSKVGSELSLEVFPHATETVEYRIGPFLGLNTIDPLHESGSMSTLRSTDGYPLFSIQSSTDLHPTYAGFDWDVHLLTGPEESRNSMPLQKFWRNYQDTPDMIQYIGWGNNPASPLADAVT